MILNSPGQIRPSQIVFTFGPGSITDLADDSVMILGQDFWPVLPRYRRINEPRLEAALRVDEFHVPISDDDSDPHIPCINFPRYRVCVICDRLAKIQRNSNNEYICGDPDCKGKTHPARFIVACVNGHIDDFPWIEWVHAGSSCGNEKLYLKSTGLSAALGDLIVHCENEGCGRRRSLDGALSKGPRGVNNENVLPVCSGSRPWIGDHENCRALPRGLLRGASNVFFSVTQASIYIPPWTDPLFEDVARNWVTISRVMDRNKPDLLSQLLPVIFPNSDISDVMAAINNRLGLTGTSDLRTDEWLALRSRTPINKQDFELVPETVPQSLADFVETLARLPRLREVRALVGFTRIDPPDPAISLLSQARPISRVKKNWLPAVEVFGEGIFFALNRSKLNEWESRDEVKKRCDSIKNAYNRWRTELGYQVIEVPSKYILLHTLAHIVIRQLSLESGYSSASIRERIYAGGEAHGVLLYTASDDSDGSLGGLVQLGRPINFQSLFRGALEASTVCSSDPLCNENDPAITSGINGSACHVCCFVSETSCERSNRLLDRRTLLPSSNESASFFDSYGAS